MTESRSRKPHPMVPESNLRRLAERQVAAITLALRRNLGGTATDSETIGEIGRVVEIGNIERRAELNRREAEPPKEPANDDGTRDVTDWRFVSAIVAGIFLMAIGIVVMVVGLLQ